METKEVLAGKIVPKSKLTKPHQKEKVRSRVKEHGDRWSFLNYNKRAGMF